MEQLNISNAAYGYNQDPGYLQQQNANPYNQQLQYGNPNLYPQLQPNVGYIPPGASGGDVVIVYREGQPQHYHNSDKQIRIAEIDSHLQNGFTCYVCWLWFVIIVTTIALFSSIISWANLGSFCIQYYGGGDCYDANTILAIELLVNLFNILTFSVGLTAIKNKSISRNQAFVILLFMLIVLKIIIAILSYTAYSYYFGNGFGAFSAIIGVIIVVLVVVSALKVSNLLKEREALLNSA